MFQIVLCFKIILQGIVAVLLKYFCSSKTHLQSSVLITPVNLSFSTVCSIGYVNCYRFMNAVTLLAFRYTRGAS